MQDATRTGRGFGAQQGKLWPKTCRCRWVATALVGLSAAMLPAGASQISGIVFEDVNYGGGAGRDRVAASGVTVQGATVELYNGAGAFLQGATTNGSGRYQFNSLADGSYQVRVVNATVGSTRSGADGSEVLVQTFRTDASGGTPIAVPGRVGGERPSEVDAPANGGSDTLAALNAPAGQEVQSLSPVTISGAPVRDVDFGFNADTIVNSNDSAQGSLRRFILNANLLGNAGLAQAGFASGEEAGIFMLPSSTDPWARPVDPGFDTGSGVFTIVVATNLPAITDDFTTIDGTTQTTHVGDTNAAILGTGGTVGVDGLTLNPVPGPEVELRGGGTPIVGIGIQSDDVTIRGLAIYGFGTGGTGHSGIHLANNTQRALIESNVIGSGASVLADPGAGSRNFENVYVNGADGGILRNNFIGFGGIRGAFIRNGSTGWVVERNELRDNSLDFPGGDGIAINASTVDVVGNLIVGSSSQGYIITNASGNRFTNNTVTGNGLGISSVDDQSAGITMRPGATSNTLARNVIRANYGAGIQVNNGASGNRITRNAISDNGTVAARNGDGPTGTIGIDLNSSGDDSNLGTFPFVTTNDAGDGDSGGNDRRNFAVLDSAAIQGSNLALTGWSAAGTLIELFISDGDGTNFGEGETYLISLTEGGTGAGGDDTHVDSDASTGSYGPGAINGIVQGQDNTSRFRFTFPVPPGVSLGTLLTATATDGGGNTSEFGGVVPVSVTPAIVKRAFRTDGTAIATGSTIPRGMPVRFLLYVDNPGGALTDVTLVDALDPAFVYEPGTMKMDATLSSSVVCPAGICDETAIFMQVDGLGAPVGDGDSVTAPLDSDAVSYDSGTRRIEVGDGDNGDNATLALAADGVWALTFTVIMQ